MQKSIKGGLCVVVVWNILMICILGGGEGEWRMSKVKMLTSFKWGPLIN